MDSSSKAAFRRSVDLCKVLKVELYEHTTYFEEKHGSDTKIARMPESFCHAKSFCEKLGMDITTSSAQAQNDKITLRIYMAKDGGTLQPPVANRSSSSGQQCQSCWALAEALIDQGRQSNRRNSTTSQKVERPLRVEFFVGRICLGAGGLESKDASQKSATVTQRI